MRCTSVLQGPMALLFVLVLVIIFILLCKTCCSTAKNAILQAPVERLKIRRNIGTVLSPDDEDPLCEEEFC